MAFAEQFIYLCLRHLTVLLRSAPCPGALMINDRDIIRKPRLSEDNFYADRTSGGVSLTLATASFARKAKLAVISRSAPFVGGICA